MGEHLDDLLALHHLFDVAVHLAEVALLLDEVLAGLLAGDLFEQNSIRPPSAW